MSARRHESARLLQERVLALDERSVRPGHSLWHQAVGVMVHRGAAALAGARSEPHPVLAGTVTDWVNANAKDTKVFGNLSKARAQITGSICVYLARYAPGPDARYLGTEIAYDLEGERGRIDLAWLVPDLGVVIDEIKTQSWTNLAVDDEMLAQVHRYRRFGISEWGDAFAGVRFLPLRFPSEMRFVEPDGTVQWLSESVAAQMARTAA